MAVVRAQLHKHKNILAEVITPHQRRLIERLAQPHGAAFVQAEQPQSGEIFGVLNQMKETFETNLKSAQNEETANNRAYEGLKAAKEEELSAGRTGLETK